MVEGFNDFKSFLDHCREHGKNITVIVRGNQRRFETLQSVEQDTIARKWWKNGLKPVISGS